jgi:hypothetical protein
MSDTRTLRRDKIESMKTNLGIVSEPLKSIPYLAQNDPEGANHGFKRLKFSDIDIGSIPEAAADPQLLDLIREINKADSPLFSVGCDNLCIEGSNNRFAARSYIEVAFNEIEQAGDQASYFWLFVKFTEYAKAINLPLYFLFEIRRVEPLEHMASGFTVEIWIMIPATPTREQVIDLWRSGLLELKKFIASLPKENGGTPIYAACSEAESRKH